MMDDFRRRNKRLKPKKKSRCQFKREGIKCNCGSFGKKFTKPPYPYKDHPKAIMRARKWKKKQGIEIVKSMKRMFE